MFRWSRPIFRLLQSSFRAHATLRIYNMMIRPYPLRATQGMLTIGGVCSWMGWREEKGFREAVEKVLPSTVQIQVEITLTFSDGLSVWGKLLALDLESDLALVMPSPQDGDKLDLSKYPPVTFNPEKLRLGDQVAALGNPLGLRNSLTIGVVGGVNRSNEEARQPDSRIRYLQTDLHTNPGSSGGPLFTADGKVVGIITTRAEVEGISFAIQINSVRSMILQLEEQRRIFRPWVGFTGITLSPELILQVTCPHRRQLFRSIGNGVLVTKAHQPASNLQPGDIITHVNDIPVTCLGDILMQSTPESPELSLVAVRMVKKNGDVTLTTFNSIILATEFDLMLARRKTAV